MHGYSEYYFLFPVVNTDSRYIWPTVFLGATYCGSVHLSECSYPSVRSSIKMCGTDHTIPVPGACLFAVPHTVDFLVDLLNE